MVNGDAEQGPGGTAQPVTSVAGWTLAEGAPALLGYDLGQGYPTRTDPGPPQRGSRFFGGGDSPRTVLLQDVALPERGATGRQAVDAGRVRFAVEAWLGGYAPQQDGARLSVEFRDGQGTPLALAVLGPVTAQERSHTTGLFRRTAEAALPPRSRTARLQLVLTRAGGGTSNDGYADALSLTLRQAGGRA
ncbi:phosphoesterase [Streptomyces sp. 549]|uniref:phosphoesterase n=1 Tax=Streptomyces sp. 549 TaxID=3049076 RepID=UPI0024C37677|nr:phosphoesterase [Streptomyces sp. 549]MDK1476488.1 phosphoesterase [Streptomyces sp. 549]